MTPEATSEMTSEGAKLRRHRRRRFSPLMFRIMAVNVLALAMLVGGLLYLDQFRSNLINSRTKELTIQAQIIAGALGEAATGDAETAEINLRLARQILARLVVPAEIRGRLFGIEGKLLSDSRNLAGHGTIRVAKLSSKMGFSEMVGWIQTRFSNLIDLVMQKPKLPVYREKYIQRAHDYKEVQKALQGDSGFRLRSSAEQNNLIISVAVPVQRFKRVLGALMLTTDTAGIDDLVQRERMLILRIFGVATAITLLLSLFLARTIVHPIHQLAAAADRVRMGEGRGIEIPDFSKRHDEIGDLSIAFRAMMQALYLQIDAVAAFAADVSHEMKNPLTSLRSAVESVAKAKDPVMQARLMAIIQDDVKRLDRLISDISDASRLDAELSRAKMEPVDLTLLLRTFAEGYEATRKAGMPVVKLKLPSASGPDGGEVPEVIIRGFPGRLGQVISNLVGNAVSFSPQGGEIDISLERRGTYVQIAVADQGPGIPEDKLEAIFDRFYTERPESEAFGQHSGLGLNISRQIVTAHQGEIFAENLYGAEKFGTAPDAAGDGAAQPRQVRGARFVVRLPL
jgi:two-component system sensor histidine kinase ChvG